MKLKTRIATTIMSMALALSVMAFAVFAAATQTLSITNTVSFVSQHVLATVTGWVTGAENGSFTDYTELTRGEGKTTTTADDDDGVLGTWEIGDNMQFANENAPIFVNITVKNNSLERPLSFELIGYQYGAWNGIDLGDKNIDRAVTYSIDNEVPASGTYAGGEAQVEPLATATIVIRLDITNTGKSVSAFDNSFIMKLRNIGGNTVYGPGEEPGEGNFVAQPVLLPQNIQVSYNDFDAYTDEENPAFYGLFSDPGFQNKLPLPYTPTSEQTVYAKLGDPINDGLYLAPINGNEYEVYSQKFYDENEGYIPLAQGVLEIPATYNGKPVTRIGDWAFNYSLITEVIMSDTITHIGTEAFYSSYYLTNVVFSQNLLSIEWGAFAETFDQENPVIITLPNSLQTVGESAFSGASISEVRIGESLSEIYLGAFETPYLEKYVVASSNAHYKDIDGVLFSKDETVLIHFPESKIIQSSTYNIPNGVTNIADFAFKNNSGNTNLDSVIIPEGVTTIGDYAFNNATFDSIDLPSTLISIGEFAFSHASITSLVLPQNLTTIGGWAFSASELETISFPESLVNVGTFALHNTPWFESNKPSEGVFYAGKVALSFFGEGPVELLPDTKGVAGMFLFVWHTENLTEIQIPASVEYISQGAFEHGWSLDNIVVDEGNQNYSSQNGVLFNKNKSELVFYPRGKTEQTYNIPGTVETIAPNAFSANNFITELEIPNTVTSIGEGAFRSMLSLVSAYILADLTELPNDMFLACESLTEVNIPANVTKIGDGAFAGTRALTEIILPENLTHIGQYAFEASGLTSINLNEGLQFIGSRAFIDTNIESLVIPNSVTMIEFMAFEDNKNLTSVTIGSGVKVLSESMFSYCTNLTDVTILGDINRVEYGFLLETTIQNLYLEKPLVLPAEPNFMYFDLFHTVQNVYVKKGVVLTGTYFEMQQGNYTYFEPSIQEDDDYNIWIRVEGEFSAWEQNDDGGGDIIS